MKGFDNRWPDLPAFILGITEEVWEGRGLGARLREYYAKDVIVRTPAGLSQRQAAAVQAAMAALHEFPDSALLGEDVIWSGDPEAGMLCSQRILSQATHSGSGMFGPATGRPVSYRTIADRYAKDNQISDAWVVRDTGAIVRQLGHRPDAWAAGQVAEAAAAGAEIQPFTPEIDVIGPYTGHGNTAPWGERIASLLSHLMTAEFSAIPAEYDRACELAYPGGLTGHGHRVAERFWLPLRGAFPSARFTLHHVIGRADLQMPPRAAVRWSLWGRHDGWGAFGAPSGAQVYVMGITHVEFGPRGLRREWTLYDEAAIWTQIHLSKG